MRDRFTPAHAGNTPDCRGRHLRIEVHPRSRGEYRISVAACFQSSGSPPLTRGIRSFSNPLFQVARFTPAHAGNTQMYLVFQFLTQVHPRSRGEYFHRIRKDFLNCRFTPAHAGNTLFCCQSSQLRRVHPRSRGEYRSEAQATGS